MPGGHRWDQGRGVRPHVVPSPLARVGGTPLLAATCGAMGCAAPQLHVPGERHPCPQDPPCPPSSFAEPTVRPRRRPSLVALPQPCSASISSSIHLTDRVSPLPAPACPKATPARPGLCLAEEGRHTMLPVCSQYAPSTLLEQSQHSHGAVDRAAALPSQAVARGLCVPGEPCLLSPITPPALCISQRKGRSAVTPSVLTPSPLPTPALGPSLPAELLLLLHHSIMPSQAGSGSWAPVSYCKRQSHPRCPQR